DGGRTWSRPLRPAGPAHARADQQWPAVGIGAHGRVTVAWNDDSTGVQRVYVAHSVGGGRRFRPPRPLDPRPPRGTRQWRAARAEGGHGAVHAAFVDERARSEDDDLPQAGIYYARVTRGVPERARRLDAGAPAALAAKLDNAWAPRVAVRGR